VPSVGSRTTFAEDIPAENREQGAEGAGGGSDGGVGMRDTNDDDTDDAGDETRCERRGDNEGDYFADGSTRSRFVGVHVVTGR